jgi:AbrB family looped-hinge helix DNA binding protein
MQSVVSSRGQTVIPASVRRQHHIEEGDQILWIDEGQTIRVVPLPADPISALRGAGRGERLVERLLEERRLERERER